MYDTDRSAYPHPDEFKVKRPEYTELEDGYYRATIEIAPSRSWGRAAPGRAPAAWPFTAPR
ncbi:hypothetical protein [Rhodothermus marinus]|uniref:hypothetical protein n=1 Tax=Rhodothermus marinus TaxID=29549 RepID=UPI000B313DD9|nr:hypothetical protein [Rhodothermus marinus]